MINCTLLLNNKTLVVFASLVLSACSTVSGSHHVSEAKNEQLPEIVWQDKDAVMPGLKESFTNYYVTNQERKWETIFDQMECSSFKDKFKKETYINVMAANGDLLKVVVERIEDKGNEVQLSIEMTARSIKGGWVNKSKFIDYWIKDGDGSWCHDWYHPLLRRKITSSSDK